MRRGRHWIWGGLIGVALIVLLNGCAHIPEVPENVSTGAAAELSVQDTRGRLSQRETTALLKRLAAQTPDANSLQRHLMIEQAVSGRPLYTGNRVTPLRDGPDAFAATFAAIHQAQHYIYLEYYILEDVQWNGEQLSDLLISRAQQGVQIDVMYDTLGSLSTPSDFFDRLRTAGIRVRNFNAFSAFSPYSSLNSRDHRKILVADGQLSIIGGVNLSTDYQSLSGGSGPRSGGGSSGSIPRDSEHAGSAPGSSNSPPPRAHGTPPEPWHDTDLQIEGPAVRELVRLFALHWQSQGGTDAELVAIPSTEQMQPRGDEVVRIVGSEHGRLVPRYYATLLAGIRSASSQVWVTAAYFVPTRQERQALARAARRGVDVRLLLPSHSDSPPALAVQQSYYGGLLHAGVKIFERQDGILHSKTIVTDSVWSIVGSSNFDHRSVLFNDEVDAVVIGRQTGEQLEQYFRDGQDHAQQVDAATWHERPFKRKLRERWWRLWEQWL
jgi:cardiolipin synthase A/B